MANPMCSKLSYQVGKPLFPKELVQQVYVSGVDIVKILEPYYGEVKPFGNIDYINRPYFDGEPDKEMVWEGERGADRWANLVHPVLDRAPWALWVEGPNEPVIYTPDRAKLLVEFSIRAAEHVHSWGFKYLGYVFSTCHPDLSLWPILVEGLSHFDGLALHEYDMGNLRLDGDGKSNNDYVLRYRHIIEICRQNGFVIPDNFIFITEGGVDRGGDPKNDGWRARGISELAYLDWFKWLDSELRRNPEVRVETPFVWNHGDWPSFEMMGRMSRLYTDYISSCNGFESWLWMRSKPFIIPQSKGTALFDEGVRRGWHSAGDEFGFDFNGVNYVGRHFYDAEQDTLVLAFVEWGMWGDRRNIHFIYRQN